MNYSGINLMQSTLQQKDDEARKEAQQLMQSARYAALSVLDEKNYPFVSRIAFGLTQRNTPISLVSTLSHHTQHMLQNSQVSLLIGEPKPRGDPLTYPRLTLQGTAHFLQRNDPDFIDKRTEWLETHPKSRLYIDFTDFQFVQFSIFRAYLNGGFGKAYKLSAKDLKIY